MTEQKLRMSWTPDHIAMLQAMVATHSVSDIAQHLGCAERAVRRKLGVMNISLRQVKHNAKPRKVLNPPRRWTEQEEMYLSTHYGERPLRKIAKHLKRSTESVRQKAHKMGIHDDAVRDASSMLSRSDVAALLGVSPDTVQTWWREHDLPYEKRFKQYFTYESAVLTWLRTDANVLRLSRERIEPRLQRIYDAVRREYYTLEELNALDVAALQPRRWKWEATRRHDVSPPKAIVIGRHGMGNSSVARLSRQTYYRKDEVWAWAWAFGHIIPEKVRHPDIADIVLAWRSRYLLNAELYAHIAQTTVSRWYTTRGFPRQARFRICYDRIEVVAWLKAHGYAREAHQLDRGGILCYHDLIRDRERRGKASW